MNPNLSDLQAKIFAFAVAGGILLERMEKLPEAEAACGFAPLHAEVSDLLLSEDDQPLRVLLVGSVAAGCMLDADQHPSVPPTVDGAFDVFSEWAHAEGRSFADLRRVYQLGADAVAEIITVFNATVNAVKAFPPESNSQQEGEIR